MNRDVIREKLENQIMERIKEYGSFKQKIITKRKQTKRKGSEGMILDGWKYF